MHHILPRSCIVGVVLGNILQGQVILHFNDHISWMCKKVGMNVTNPHLILKDHLPDGFWLCRRRVAGGCNIQEGASGSGFPCKTLLASLDLDLEDFGLASNLAGGSNSNQEPLPSQYGKVRVTLLYMPPLPMISTST